MKTVALGGKKAAGRVTCIDDADLPEVETYKWHVDERIRPNGSKTGPYAVATVPGGTVKLHKLLTGWPETDHADGDGLNNQRYNLRPGTGWRNRANTQPDRGAASSYKGVCFRKQDGYWMARVTLDGRRVHCSLHHDEVEAAVAYDAAAVKYFGEYARLNFPPGTPVPEIARPRESPPGEGYGSSAFIGVSLRRSGRWQAKVGNQSAGTFDTEIEAARAHDAAATEQFGPSARLNFPAAA
jgi:hypothetical protein